MPFGFIGKAAGPSVRTRVKICGITRPEDGVMAAHAGADAIGLVFYPRSPRFVTPDQAVAVVRALPPFVTVVGLFVNEQPGMVRAMADAVGLDLLQFHGDEAPDYCRQFNQPYIKALRVRPDSDLLAAAQGYREARGLLLDAWHETVPGGSGAVFDWELIPEALRTHCILAGGLAPDNVAAAIDAVRPYAVDVSSGVEADKGIKDPARIQAFMRGVSSGDTSKIG
ncbi:MAG TPA: phosphoribosylanthranilate isomerase [Gammaproteobacteria bacterium]|nr:phosphoribosylanthranilate isomerase [Gammaproteobacteria bacterium]